ncbi:NADH-quinone oxidoreductase subunit J family protein [Leekyejoonella antrihumi]|uniref:NADH-quinone oxidoreductase subunit J n=1 Tax=Leekyejoonella antrihumi TaxID=1660198 RepID=A0A563E480_9MICO|nr:NADH-quinone oxidoreductase subunit J [Leekyejoonella antrihumi]TWP37330.1 NADH-quinone oxidoreductase subunit J [Leekyejoonella antrihumi]
MTTHDVFFTIVGVICAASALLSVTTKHLVHAALWLMVALVALSGCYLVLGAELVALVNLLIYVGAIVVLVLFALMLTRAPIGRSHEHDTSLAQRAASMVLCAATTALLAAVLISGLGNNAVRVSAGSTHTLSVQLFGTWVWPFEMLSLLLVAALVGALAVSRLPNAAIARTESGEGS